MYLCLKLIFLVISGAMPKKQDRGQVKWLFSEENAVKHSKMQKGNSQLQQVPQNPWLVTTGDQLLLGVHY